MSGIGGDSFGWTAREFPRMFSMLTAWECKWGAAELGVVCTNNALFV